MSIIIHSRSNYLLTFENKNKMLLKFMTTTDITTPNENINKKLYDKMKTTTSHITLSYNMTPIGLFVQFRFDSIRVPSLTTGKIV